MVHLQLACATPGVVTLEYLGGHEAADQLLYTNVPMPANGVWSPNPKLPGLGLELNEEAFAWGVKSVRVS